MLLLQGGAAAQVLGLGLAPQFSAGMPVAFGRAPHPTIAAVLQCVPFARRLSSVSLFGNAWTWWNQAAGLYDRGTEPRPGSVLVFRPDLPMPLGHVAVVTRVTGARGIEIDHANWAMPGAVSREVPVVDVSTANDWSSVRVGLVSGRNFGRVYGTYGFIHPRPVDPSSLPPAKPAASPDGSTPSSFVRLGSGSLSLPVVLYGVGWRDVSGRTAPNVPPVLGPLPRVIYGMPGARAVRSPTR